MSDHPLFKKKRGGGLVGVNLCWVQSKEVTKKNLVGAIVINLPKV